MTFMKNLKKRGVKVLFCAAIVLTLLGGAKLGVESASTAHAAPAHQQLACGGDAFPPCW